jgi:hypothetical protein
MIWRTSTRPNATSGAGWSSIAATNVGAGSGYVRRISALGISTAASPNVLYYGTVDGIVMRATSINTGTPTVTTITPPGLNGGTALGGFRALRRGGSNGIPTARWSRSATTTSRACGTRQRRRELDRRRGQPRRRRGPSIRWATMFYVDGQLEVFLGTSIGVLSTTALAGGATVWAQEAGRDRQRDRRLHGLPRVRQHARGRNPRPRRLHRAPRARRGRGREPVAQRAMLSPSFPNPASASATIAYDLPRAGDVSLQLYDVTGREVATLVKGHRESGRHVVPVATGRLAPGAYYYVLRVGDAVETRKLIVAR